MRSKPTAATLLAVPAFLRERVRRKYPRDATRILQGMQKILILTCEERWTLRQEARNEHETRTGKRLAEKRTNWTSSQGGRHKKRSQPADEAAETTDEQKRQRTLDGYAGFAGAHVSKGQMGSIRSTSGASGTSTQNRATGRGRGSHRRGRAINTDRGNGRGTRDARGMAARGGRRGTAPATQLQQWLIRR